MKPTDPTCIYSTFLFVIDQATKLGIDTPSITFDQQLWIIALEDRVRKVSQNINTVRFS